MDGRRTSNAASTTSTTNSNTTNARESRRSSNTRNGASAITRKLSDTSRTSAKSVSSAASASSSRNGSAHDKDRTLTSFPPLPASADTSPHVALKKSELPALGGAPFASPSLQVTSRRARPAPTNTRLVPASLERLFEPADVADTKNRDALFDDQAAQGVHYTPGTLHHQSTASIEHLIQRVGAVQLVKQLSEDLAQRDARVTTLQRKAEERERLLRKMLQECEVSNLDIEDRIRESERERKAREESGILSPGLLNPGLHNASTIAEGSGSIDDQMSEALGDDIGTGLDSTAAQRSRQGSTASAQISVRSSDDAKPKTATTRGWKGYFKYGSGESSSKGTGAKSTDTGTIKRRPQQRPLPGERNPSATASLQDNLLSVNKQNDDAGVDTDSAASSTSVASWAMKFIGARPAPQADPSKKKHLAREKAASISGGISRSDKSRSASQSREGSKKNGTAVPDKSSHKRGGSFATQLRNTAAASLPLPSSPPDGEGMHITNLGPVEMETILSDGDRPPTLVEGTAAHGYLTDRFGFIYDQRRRKRQNEAAAILKQQRASIGETLDTTVKSLNAHTDADDSTSIVSRASETSLISRPDSPFSGADADGQKGWSDYLNIFNMKGELLSHMPAAVPTTSITTADFDVDLTNTKAPSIVIAKRVTEPALASVNASATNSVSENAETSLDVPPENLLSPSSPVPDPVQTLLAQLTEVHDKLQRERTERWNEFLKRVRAERTRAGDGFGNRDRRAKGLATMPETFLGDGEVVGVAGLGNKGKVGRAKWNEFRSLVLAGIPVAYRAKIWAECSGASELRQPGYYEELVRSQDKHDPSVAQQIQMDIHRTLTDNVFFRVGQGVTRLNEVLLAYARRNPDVGYCQGMNLIAANLLLIMPSAEDAFWVLCSMIENILPAKYFDNSLLTSRADQVVLRGYVTELLPQLSSHLESLNIDLEAFTFQWFLSVFTDCLSAEALFRVWDVVLCVNDGATFLFQVGLALLKLNEKQLLASTAPAEVYAYISQQMTDHAISIDGLIRASEGLRKVVKREDVVRRREEAVDRELEAVRAREALRKGKGKARAEALEAFPLDDTPPDSSTEGEEQKKKKRASSPPMARAYRPSRQPSNVSSAEDAILDDTYQEPLTLRTPMPVDEEGGWMA